MLEANDIDLVVEPHPGDFLETTRAAVDLVKEVAHPRLRYLHCLPYAFYLAGTLTEQIEYAAGWFDHVHVADTFRPQRTIVNPAGLDCRIHQHFNIGRGELDLVEARDALAAIGFDGILTVQVFGWEDQAEQSFRESHSAATRRFGHNGKGSPS